MEGHTVKVFLLLVALLQVTSFGNVHSLEDEFETKAPGGSSAEKIQKLPGESSTVEDIPPPPPDGGAKPLPDEASSLNNTRDILAPSTGADLELPNKVPPSGETETNNTLEKEQKEKEEKDADKEEEPREKAGFGGPMPDFEDSPNSPEVQNSHADKEGSETDMKEDKKGEKEEQEQEVLLRCGVCPPGTGVVTACTKTRDTICAPCPEGTFSPGYSSQEACRPCNVCPPGYYKRTPCVPDSDVRCGACNQGGSGFGNENFREKCEGVTSTTSTTSPPTERPEEMTTGGEGSGEELEEEGLGAIGVNKDEDPFEMLSQDTVAPPNLQIINQDAYRPEEVNEARVGESKGDEEKVMKVTSGGFQWPILLAGIASGIVFFVVGIVTSMLCKRTHYERKRSVIQEDFGEDPVRTTMFRRSADYSPSDESSYYPDSDAASPLNPVHVTALCHGPAQSVPLTRNLSSLYNSADLKYIDEDDSEDELVNMVAAPSRSLIDRIRDSPIIARITRSPRMQRLSVKRPLQRHSSTTATKFTEQEQLQKLSPGGMERQERKRSGPVLLGQTSPEKLEMEEP